MGSLRHPKMNFKHSVFIGSENTCPVGVNPFSAKPIFGRKKVLGNFIATVL